jgi:uncharacterized integral membrane protein
MSENRRIKRAKGKSKVEAVKCSITKKDKIVWFIILIAIIILICFLLFLIFLKYFIVL